MHGAHSFAAQTQVKEMAVILYMGDSPHLFTPSQVGNTALIWASANGQTEAVQALVAAGVNASIRNKVRCVHICAHKLLRGVDRVRQGTVA